MSVRGTWQITIKRTDGSEYCYTEFLGRAPQLHELIETAAKSGHLLRARIEGLHHTPPKLAGLGIWEIAATEI
jgi:hypothetical protein